MAENSSSKISRRDFLKISTAAGAGLVVGIYLSGCQDEAGLTPVTPSATSFTPPTAKPTQTPENYLDFQPNVFIRIDTDGQVAITASKPELGQGTRTALPMIVAEELEVDWTTIRIEQAQADSSYKDQSVGGSDSISGMYLTLRKAGAAVRGLLIAAAADIWEVDPNTCYAKNSTVIHQPSGNSMPYGDLVNKATEMKAAPSELKDNKDFRLIGTPVGRIDNSAIVSGTAIFGSDVTLPGMLYAAVARAPQIRNKIESYDDTQALAIPGVRHVVKIDNKIAVVAENTWQALKGREALKVTWSQVVTDSFSASQFQDETEKSADTLSATYVIPHFAHLTMEPMNCVADVQGDSCVVWAPTQVPMKALQVTRSVVNGTPASENVVLHTPLSGGGFGRRLQVDYVTEAVKISQAVGAPVKVFWTREDDVLNDFFHPSNSIQVEVSLDQLQMPRLRTNTNRSPARTGAWRAVGNNDEAFARECFLDEYAEALGMGPVDLRMLLYPEIRLKNALEKVAAEANWGASLPAGRAMGIACFSTWDVTHVAEIAEVSLEENGKIRVHRVVCAVDCGIVINPNMVREQMEGGIVFALSAALGNEISLKDGQVEQSNFDDSPILRMDEMPEIEVHIMPSQQSPRGVGEMGGPPAIPAVANALYQLTGKRIRRLPFRL